MSQRTRPKRRPPGPLRRAWGRFISKTIWAPGAQPLGEKNYHLVAQVDLPAYDLLIGVFAVYGVIFTIPAIEIVWGVYFVHLVTSVIIVSVSVALVALIFRLHRLEVWSKVVLILTLIIYPASTATLALNSVGNRESLAFLLFALIVTPAGRVRYLILTHMDQKKLQRTITAITRETPTVSRSDA